MRSRNHHNTVTTCVTSRKGTVVHVSSNNFLSLTHRESQALSFALTHHIILVVFHHLTSNHKAESKHGMLITCDESLTLTVIRNCRTFRLVYGKTKRADTHVFFKRFAGGMLVEKLVILGFILCIRLTVPSIDTGPQGLGKRATIDNRHISLPFLKIRRRSCRANHTTNYSA